MLGSHDTVATEDYKVVTLLSPHIIHKQHLKTLPWHIVVEYIMVKAYSLTQGAMLCFYAVLAVCRAKVPDLTLLSQKASIVISEAQHLHIYQVTKQ